MKATVESFTPKKENSDTSQCSREEDKVKHDVLWEDDLDLPIHTGTNNSHSCEPQRLINLHTNCKFNNQTLLWMTEGPEKKAYWPFELHNS